MAKPSRVSKGLKTPTKSTAMRRAIKLPRAMAMPRWIWPTRSTRISGGVEAGHVAFDIAPVSGSRAGDPVWAPIGGQVTHIGESEFGYDVRLFVPGENVEVVFAHLAGSAPGLQVGQTVRQGQLLGLMGSSGMDYLRQQGITPEVHLHYEIREPGPDVFGGQRSTTTAIDPRRFYPLGATSPNVASPALPASLAAFNFASPTQAAAAGPGAPSSGGKMPRQVPSKTTATPSGTGTSSKGTSTATKKSGTPVGESTGTPGGIVIANTPFGEITIPRPGALFVKSIVGGLAALLILVSIKAIFDRAKSDTGKKVGGLVADLGKMVPGVGGAVSGVGKAQVQYSSGKKRAALGSVARAGRSVATRGAVNAD